MEKKIQIAAELLKNSKHTSAFTGAGISVESGIPPFRGPEGLWSKYDPNTLDLGNFYRKPYDAWIAIKEIFYDFFGKATPNKAHEVLARMEKEGILNSVITQNIDNLHQEAGSKTVHEFHGSAQTMICTKCGHKNPSEKVDLSQLPPVCAKCKGILKPDFIFFGEGIPELAYSESINEANKSEIMLIIGTTGEIMPACMIPHQAKRENATIIEINPEKSSFTDSITDIFLQGKATEVMSKLEKAIFG